MNNQESKQNEFEQVIHRHKIDVQRGQLRILQINLGRRCNQACVHCHMEAGPERDECMDRSTIDRVLALLQKNPTIRTVDLTGGAPELNPEFRYLVEQITQLGVQVIDRCNLTVLFEDGMEQLPEFLVQNNVKIIASLPCYQAENVDAQRGQDVYQKSIVALKRLNDLGYGDPQGDRKLDLVYNPSGAFLPPEQRKLEKEYKEQLFSEHGIVFNKLLTITNMPIKRFAELLEQEQQYEAYCSLLKDTFNAVAAKGIMCKELISIGWDGKLYDCDFNQAQGITVKSGRTIWDINCFNDLRDGICFDTHCFGCTAGSGSSCAGALS